jgi:ABC-2 type transport system permease protein
MNGFSVFLAKELLEIRRTWRIWVIPGLTIFFAITGPILALFTPELLRALATTDSGMVIKLPDPTAREAFGQFLQNMGQIVMIALVIAGAGSVSGERTSGTAILALTKPLSRPAFILAKVVSQQILLVISTVLGTIVTIGVTAALFDNLPVRPFVHGVLLWLAFALFFAAVMTLCSVMVRSRGGAAGAGLFFLFSTLIASAFPLIAKWTFAGLTTASTKALLGQSPSVLWPLLTATVGMIAATVVAVGIFRRQEI